MDAVILHCVKQLNGERTVYGIFHLLNGKRSSQTIQDAHLYGLTSFFQTASFLSRADFQTRIQFFHHKGWIMEIKEETFLISNRGETTLERYFLKHAFPVHINGWELQKISDQFWKRLTLLIQVLSHSLKKETHYFPIQRDVEVQRWIKQFLRSSGNREILTECLLHELHALFSEDNFPIDPLFIVTRLSGAGYIGHTLTQCADAFRVEETEFYFLSLEGLHYLINRVMNEKKSFSVLNQIISDLFLPISLTESTMKTYQELQRGWSKERIAEKRRLKIATIEDHIIEIALNDKSFNMQMFIHEKDAQKVVQASKTLPHKKLKPLKELFPQLSYFQIRLALAKGVNGYGLKS
ncbi:helix-turn-helix domain-containing protein [Bacillus sp. 2205SS5-2]|uniref:helix-turn-helix domain-containing protein n=1 Tax=Bacillus sp. 2205SS5-2 TaxID=3109031 RepID=UPI0030075E83